MNNKEYLSEERYQKVKKVLITIGCISLIIGIGLFVGSFFIKVPAMGQEGWFEESRTQTLLRFAAFPFGIIVPLLTFTSAFRREITGFSAQQVMPVAQEGIEKMAPTVGKAAGTIAKEIKEGLKDEEK